MLHTWSLAVEEQFYVVFPLILILMNRYSKKIKLKLVLLIFVISLIISCWGVYAKQYFTFFMLPTRMWELVLGSIIALHLEFLTRALAKIPSDLVGLTGLGLTVLPVFAYGKNTIFPGANALAPCLGAAMLIVSGYIGRSIVVRCLEWRPVVLIGLISYPLYLWHWPMLSFAHGWNFGFLGTRGTIVVLVLALGLSWLTYRFIEHPVRRRLVLNSRATLFQAAASASSAIALLAFLVVLTNGLPQRVPEELRSALLLNGNIKGEWSYPCENYKRDVSPDNPIAYCAIGNSEGHSVFFWGDSLIEQIFSEVGHLVETRNQNAVRVIFAASGGCPPLVGLERRDAAFHCSKFNLTALSRALETDIRKVVISGAWTSYFPSEKLDSKASSIVKSIDGKRVRYEDHADLMSSFADSLRHQVEFLKAAGKQVILVMPYPAYSVSLPEFIWRRQLYRLPSRPLLTWQEYLSETQELRDAINTVAQVTGAEVADPAAILCEHQLECRYQEDGVSLYMDSVHLIPRGVRYLEPMLSQLIGADKVADPR